MFGISKVTLCKSRIALTGVWIARIFLFPYKRLQKSGVRNKKSFEKGKIGNTYKRDYLQILPLLLKVIFC